MRFLIIFCHPSEESFSAALYKATCNALQKPSHEIKKINLSIKDKESFEEKQALSEYGSSDSGASLGDILGDALKKKKENDD